MKKKAVNVKRQAIPKGLRFQVLQRDNYTCQYCGRKAPDVELHIDHITPVSKGGLTELDNLVTACRDCNLGKHAHVIAECDLDKSQIYEDARELYSFFLSISGCDIVIPDSLKRGMLIRLLTIFSPSLIKEALCCNLGVYKNMGREGRALWFSTWAKLPFACRLLAMYKIDFDGLDGKSVANMLKRRCVDKENFNEDAIIKEIDSAIKLNSYEQVYDFIVWVNAQDSLITCKEIEDFLFYHAYATASLNNYWRGER